MAGIEDTIKQERFKNVTGSYARFTDIDGIGPKTANKIKNAEYGIETPNDVADMSADELSDKAGISRKRARKAIKGGGGNPNVSKQSNSGTVSAAGMRKAQGDFMVGFSELDKARAKNDARSRSQEAVRQDERRRAPVTTDYEKWKNNKSRYDFPGVDTPTQNPDLLPKDVKAGDPETTDFEARDERIKERQEQSYPRKEKEGRVLQLEGNRIPAWEVTQQEDVDDFGVFAEAMDVSLSPDEAFEGVGAVDPNALGFTPQRGEQRPRDELSGGLGEREEVDESNVKPPEQALRKQQFGASKYLDSDNSPEAIADIYEQGDFDMSLSDFGRRVRREKRTSDLPLDMFGAAQKIAEERDAFPAFR